MFLVLFIIYVYKNIEFTLRNSYINKTQCDKNLVLPNKRVAASVTISGEVTL